MDYTENKKTHETKLYIMRKLQSALSNKRYRHTIGVAGEAVKLAQTHGASVEDAEIAGLLHDCAKCMPDSLKLRLCREYRIELNEAMRMQPDLTHSFLGAEIAAQEYGISNQEILNSIRYHTTGRPGMGLLEKIIYMADFIEPNRERFNSLAKMRELSYEDLNEAVVFSLGETIKYVQRKGHVLHRLTLEAFDYYNSTKEE